MIVVTFTFDDGSEMSLETEPGDTLMNAAVKAGVPGIIAECGGGAICGTCHVHVDPDWHVVTGEAFAHEEDTLDTVANVTMNSRLACQIVLSDAMDGLTVRVPGVMTQRKVG